MNLARSLRLLLALSLLSAQQLALAHDIWHLGDKSGQPAQQQLCNQHDALGTVGGALHGVALSVVADGPGISTVSFACVLAASRPGFVPASRGPPTSR